MMKKHLFTILLILFLIPVAHALEVESYEFGVGAGINTVDLGKTYDGAYVYEINGSFHPFLNITGRYIQELEFTAAETRDNVLINITIPKNENMNSNFSDLRFLYSTNVSSVSHYIDSYNSTHVNVSLKMNVTAGSNSVIMAFGNPSAANTSNFSSLFIYYLNNSSGQNYTTNTTLYTGEYTNIDLYVAPRTGSSGTVYYYFTGLGNTIEYIPYFYHIDSSSGGSLKARFNTTTGAQVITNPSNAVNGYSHRLNLSVNSNNTVHLDSVKYYQGAVNSTNSINGNNTSATPFKMFGTGGSGTSTIFDVRIYNTTSISNLNFGTVVEVIEDGSPIGMDVPEGQFSTLTYSAENPGLILLDIFFEPHATLITPDATEFIETATLQFKTSPSPLQVSYQIALDQSFYSIINSGTSSGSISINLPANTYYWRVQQPDGVFTESRTFIITEPEPTPGYLNFTIRNELTNGAVSATVLILNNTTTLQKTGNTITFNSSEVIAGNYSVQLNATGYTTRFYDVVSPGNYTLYVLPNANASVVYFSLIDNTNTFQYDSTKLEIIKQTPNGSLVVHHSYFDATGFSIATLNNFDNYILKVVSDSGHEKILGNYIQAGQTTVQLVISDIILKENNSSLYGGFTYNLTKSESAIKLDWINPNNALTDLMLFQIYKNNELVMNISTDAPFGSINYQDNVDGEMKLDPDATYRIVLLAKTVNGTIRVNEFYKVGGESVSIDFEKIPLALRIVISLILLILVASLFNVTNAKFSAIVVTLVAGFLTLIGFLPILPSVLIWLLFVAIVAYKTNNR